MPPTWSTPGVQSLQANSGAKLGSLYTSWNAATTTSGLVAYRVYLREGVVAPNVFGMTSSYFVAEVYATAADIYQSGPITKLTAGTTYSAVVRAVDDSHSEDSNVVALSKMVPAAVSSLTADDTNDAFPFVPHYTFVEDIGYRTVTSRFESGKEHRKAIWSTPLKRFTVKLDPLKKSDIATLWTFYQDHRGTLKTFLFDADINSAEVANEAIDAIGAGLTYSGTLVSPAIKRGTFRGLVGATQQITDDSSGGLTSTLLQSGTVTYESGAYQMVFAAAPGTSVSCFYQQQVRVRFEEDVLSRELFAYTLYSTGLGMVQVK